MECFTALMLMALNSETCDKPLTAGVAAVLLQAEFLVRCTQPLLRKGVKILCSADLPSLRFQSFSLFFTHLHIHRSLLYQANPMSRNISADIKGQIVDS
jgi:hypothetical protein